jgi:hypothetical protein
LQAQSLTSCGKAKAETASANGSAVCKHNHLHPVGRQRQKQHKQRDLQFASTITYILWEGKGRNSISKGICSLQAQSLTSCGKAKAETASAKGSAVCKHNHLHTVGRQRQKQHQQRDLQFASTITYILWEGKGRNSISKGICSLQAQSLTCEKAKLWEGKGRNSISKGICSLQAQSLTSCGKAKAETA